jgi:hypothetical protein
MVWPSGVAAVVRSNHENIAIPETTGEVGKCRIKLFERSGKSLRIAPMSVQGVEITKIGKDKRGLVPISGVS